MDERNLDELHRDNTPVIGEKSTHLAKISAELHSNEAFSARLTYERQRLPYLGK